MSEKWQKLRAEARRTKQERDAALRQAIKDKDYVAYFRYKDFDPPIVTYLPPPAPSPGFSSKEALKRFYQINRGLQPIAEHMQRSTFSGYRVAVYAGSYYIAISRGSGLNHVAILYYQDQDRISHALAGTNFKGNYFIVKDVQSFLSRAVNLKQFKTTNDAQHVPY